MPLQLDELPEGEEATGDDVSADERLEHAGRVGARFAGVVDAEQRDASGELRIVLCCPEPVEGRVEVVTVEVADPEVERVLRFGLHLVGIDLRRSTHGGIAAVHRGSQGLLQRPLLGRDLRGVARVVRRVPDQWVDERVQPLAAVVDDAHAQELEDASRELPFIWAVDHLDVVQLASRLECAGHPSTSFG